MKTKLILTFSLFLSLAVAKKPEATANAVPVVDQATQLDLLGALLDVSTAQQMALPYNQAVDKARADIQSPLHSAEKQCGDKYTPDLKDHKVICKLKPEAAPLAPPAVSPIKNTPQQPVGTDGPGFEGTPGTPGPTGDPSAQGHPGTSGTVGPDGTPGVPGPVGANGPVGPAPDNIDRNPYFTVPVPVRTPAGMADNSAHGGEPVKTK